MEPTRESIDARNNEADWANREAAERGVPVLSDDARVMIVVMQRPGTPLDVDVLDACKRIQKLARHVDAMHQALIRIMNIGTGVGAQHARETLEGIGR